MNTPPDFSDLWDPAQNATAEDVLLSWRKLVPADATDSMFADAVSQVWTLNFVLGLLQVETWTVLAARLPAAAVGALDTLYNTEPDKFTLLLTVVSPYEHTALMLASRHEPIRLAGIRASGVIATRVAGRPQ